MTTIKEVLQWKGHTIIKKHGVYFVLGVVKKTLKAAKLLINKLYEYE